MRTIVSVLMGAALVACLVGWQHRASGGSPWVQLGGIIETDSPLSVGYTVSLTEPVIRTLVPSEVIRVMAVATSANGGSVSLQRNLDIRGVNPDTTDIQAIGVGPVNLSNIPVFASSALGIDLEPGAEDMSPAYTLTLEPQEGLTWGDVTEPGQVLVSLAVRE